MLNNTDLGNVTRGKGLQVLPIGGAQHVQTFCQYFQGFSAQWGFVQSRPCGVDKLDNGLGTALVPPNFASGHAPISTVTWLRPPALQDMHDRGSLHKLTCIELKHFLRRHGLPNSGVTA